MTKEELIVEFEKFLDQLGPLRDTYHDRITDGDISNVIEDLKQFGGSLLLKAFEAGEQVERKKVAEILAEEIHAAEDKKVRFALEQIVFNLTKDV